MRSDMKQIKHHLNDGLLMGYASGNLPEAFSLVVATHISLCDECRARLESFDAIGGVLIDEDAAVEMTATALEATFERIAEIPAVPKPWPHRRLQFFRNLSKTTSEAILIRSPGVIWAGA